MTPVDERVVDVAAIAEAIVDDHARRAGIPLPTADRTRIRTWSPASARKVRRRLFIQVDVDGVPVGVAKVPRSEHDPKLRHEFGALHTLPTALPFERPAPLCEVDDGFMMTYLPGLDLPSVPGLATGPREAWRIMAPAVDAVAALHTMPVPDSPGVPVDDRIAVAAQYVRTPLTGIAHVDEALLTALVAPTHGDLGPWNVRVDPADATVRVLDFEDYRPAGIAAIDVVNLLVTTALPVFPDYPEHGFDWLYDQIFLRDTWFRGLLARGVCRYAALTGQRPDRVLDLVPLMCQWLIERIEAEGRDTSGLFYRTFRTRYLDQRPDWIRRLDG